MVEAAGERTLGDSNMGFLNNSMSTSTATSPDKVCTPPGDHRSSLESSLLHIKQEAGEGLMHLIKHEILEQSMVEGEEGDDRPSSRHGPIMDTSMTGHMMDHIDDMAQDLSMVPDPADDTLEA
uniref:(California timema) hypothetical protein n=1 Tax=Timema californicum TaxID=61474 RepID=A0A7R9IWM2_TIMCA|nr:unnamed protein product [Timema californicum]